MGSRPFPGGRRLASGILTAALLVAVTTLLVFPLSHLAPPISLGVVYLVAVLVVASVWGPWLGLATALASALAYNYFHIPPKGRFTIAEGQDVVALCVFFVAAILASQLAERARARTNEAEERRREADLAAEMARVLLRGEDLSKALPSAAHLLAQALELPSAAIELQAVQADDRRVAFALRDGPRQLGTLLAPATAPERTLRRLQERVVPALEALLAAAIEREELLGDRVEAAALRRTDVVKTALLRAVSHDLRSPLTAILASVDPLSAEHLSDEDRRELASVVRDEATRLSRLIDNLLDLSRLEAGAADPKREPVEVGEVIRTAAEQLDAPASAFRLQLSADMPAITADAAQLERAFVNLLENARRHSGGEPVLVRAWPLHNRVMVRVVDSGPGIPPAQQERVFDPFFRAGTEKTGHRGSGLGLAIVRGFVEANGGRVWVESLPGQGTSFVLEFPLEAAEEPPPQGDASPPAEEAPVTP